MSVQPLYVLRQHSGEVQDTAFHPVRQTALVSGDSKGEVIVWDLQKRRPEITFTPPHKTTGTGAGILKAAWMGVTAEELLVQSKSGCVSLWDVYHLDGKPVFDICIERHGFCGVCVMNMHNVAIPGAASGVVEIWNPKESEKLCHVSANSCLGEVTAIARCGDDGGSLVVGYESGDISLWDLRMTEGPTWSHNCLSSPITCLDVDARAHGVVAGSPEDMFVAVKLQSAPGSSQRCIKLPESGLSSISIRPDRRIFVTGGWDSKVRIWNYRNMKRLGVLGYHTKEVACVQFHDDHRLACASRDGTISIWKLYSATSHT